MDDRFNTIAGWTLFGGIIALGLTAVSTRYFQADKHHRPETMGYEIEGVVSSDGDEAVPIEALLATADPAKGEKVFAKCKSCHTIEAGGANGIGPNLHGMMGETIATGHAGFAFSAALKEHSGEKWDWTNMDAWLHNPRKFAPGTKMTFAGLSKAEDRADLLVYMNSQGSNLPLPEAPAAEAEAAPTEGDAAAPAEGEAAEASAEGAETATDAPATEATAAAQD